MRKTILTTACAALIGLASIATASAQFATGVNEGISNTTTVSNSTDTRLDANNKMSKKMMMMKKKKMMMMKKKKM